ncbi:MAG: ester cyclase [Chloroflexota bacterium]
MSTQENKDIVRRSFEDLFNQGNLSVADEVYSPDYVGHDPAMPEDSHGIDDVKQFVSTYRNAFSDIHLTIDHLIAEGDLVATSFTGRGTHDGDFTGIPATGKKAEVTGMSISRLVDGKIVEEWTNTDTLGLMQQLGVLPSAVQVTNS